MQALQSLTLIISNSWATAVMAIALSGLIAQALLRRSYPLKVLTALLLLVLVSLPLVPVGPTKLSLAAIMAGWLGEVSSLSVLLVLATFVPGLTPLLRRRTLILPIVAAVLLYGSVLTYAAFDLYRLGYLHADSGKHLPLWILGALACLGVVMPIQWISLVAIACLSWALGLQASTNLWDYLFDVPSIFVYVVLLSKSFLVKAGS
jgi:hypothetical protein